MVIANKLPALLLCICCYLPCAAQTDSAAVKKHHFSGTATCWARGEIRDGALPADNGQDFAAFLMGSTTLRLEYSSSWLDVRFSPKYFGVWGASGVGDLAIDEAWFRIKKGGFFARIGRQKLSYDDQRIIGADDWAMADKTHDVVKLGYEGKKHRVHLLLAFNQNFENLNGGTVYRNGGQDYKTMQTLWYHYDPFPWLGASLIAMNTGMQSLKENENKTYFQQLFGGFLDIHPKKFSFQASFYQQLGKTERALPINAWMASAESTWQIIPQVGVRAGYFHMSGDPRFFVPAEGAVGMAQKREVRGFNPIFGSHHKFYGAMDFFYVTTYYGGNTPGLQDLHAGATWTLWKKLDLTGTYHYLATSVEVTNAPSRTLGHEFEFSASWRFAPSACLLAGYTLMTGTETMEVLKRTSGQDHLRWGWIMLIVTPKFFNL